MPPCEISCLNPKGNEYDSKKNIQCSTEDWDGCYHCMTDEEYALYSDQVIESDGFDVQLFPYVDDVCGLIQPCSLTRAANIEQSNEVVQFAIDYFNRTQGTRLQLVRVIKYMAQAAGPLNHYITFIATDNSTGVAEVYQAQMFEYIQWEKSEVGIFRKKTDHQFEEADLVQYLANFAVYHYSRTKGDDLKYINVTSFERLESSYSISFKAKNMSTGDVQIYQTEIVSRDPIQNSLVKTFRKSHIQWTNRDEEFYFFAIFAVDHYNKTQGEQLELIQTMTYHQHAESYYITFKARDLSTCMVEHYETEVVYAAPEYNSMVKMFKKLSTNQENSEVSWTDVQQALQEIQGGNISTSHKKNALKSKQPVSGRSSSHKNDVVKQVELDAGSLRSPKVSSASKKPENVHKDCDPKKVTPSTKKHSKRK